MKHITAIAVIFISAVVIGISVLLITQGSRIKINEKIDVKIDPKCPVAALTFDDGPSKITDKILDMLYKNKSVGTFFINGKNVSGNEKLIKKTVAQGNELGNHTYNHYDLTGLTKSQILYEIIQTQTVVKKILPDYPLIYIRPPYGQFNDMVLDAISYPVALWSIDSGDWTGANSEEICKTVLGKIKDGSVVIFHDTGKGTVEALQVIIPRLKEKGFQFVTLSQMYAYRQDEVEPHQIYR